jgi:type I restriction enzyme S subunit
MAEEIYREWFVRFRFPGYQEAKFEKGIPKGWGLKSVAEAIDINPSERPHKDDVKPYVGMEALSTSSMYFEVSEFRQGNAGSKFRNGDTLFPRITPCLENGKKGFVMCLDPGQIAIGSTEFIVFREKLLTPEYIYLLSCFEPFRTHAEISMVGASGRQRVAENCFSFFLIAVPPKPVLDLFTEQVRPMFGAIKNLNRQNKVLDESKSMLLPRLISGKLSVEDLDIKFPPSMVG